MVGGFESYLNTSRVVEVRVALLLATFNQVRRRPLRSFPITDDLNIRRGEWVMYLNWDHLQ